MKFNPEKLQMAVLPGRNPKPEFFDLYNSAYDLWYSVWSDFWTEREQDKPMLSDSFVKQSEVCGVFYDRQCIALTLATFCDFRLRANREDGYFGKLWPKETHRFLEPYSHEVYVGNHITTHPEWRRNAHGFSIKDLLIGCLLKRFLETSCEVMVGTMRNNRGVNELAYRFGAEKVHTYFETESSLDVDLVIFHRDRIHDNPDPVVRGLVQRAYDNMIDAKETSLKAA